MRHHNIVHLPIPLFSLKTLSTALPSPFKWSFPPAETMHLVTMLETRELSVWKL